MKTVFGWILIVIGVLNLLLNIFLLTQGIFNDAIARKLIFSAIFIGIGAWLLDSAKLKDLNSKKQIKE